MSTNNPGRNSSSYRPSQPSTPSSNYLQALLSNKVVPTSTSAPLQTTTLSDGRKISDGRKETSSTTSTKKEIEKQEGTEVIGVIPSGASAWKPAYVRMQSWNEQDMKREYTMSSLEK